MAKKSDVKLKLLEEELLQYAAIVKSSEDAIIGGTLKGIITSWNEGAEKIYGYTAKEVVGKSISLLVPPGHNDEIPDILAKIKKGKIVTHFQTVRITKNSQLIHVSITISPMKDLQGKIIGVSAIARDITEQKRMEEELILKSRELSGSNIELKQAKDYLHESHELFQKAIMQADAVLYQYDYTTNKRTFFSENIKALTGYSREELTSDVWQGLIQECVMKGANEGFSNEEALQRILSGEINEWKADCRIRRRDGETCWLFDSSIQLVDIQGKGYLGILQDITERKLAEINLRNNHVLYQEAITQAEAVLYQFDYATHKRTFFSENIKDLTGYTSEELTADIWKELIQECVMKGVNEGLSDKEALRRVMSGEIKEWKADCRIRRRDGETRWIFDSSIQLEDGQRKPIRSLGILQDITERKLAEINLRNNNEIYHKTIAQADAILYQKDYKTKKFLYIGENIKKITGYTSEELTPEIWKGLIEECIMRGVNEGLSPEEAVRRIRSGEVKEWKADYRIRRRDGEMLWVSDSSIQLLDNQQNPIAFMGILQDITERKLAEINLRNNHERYQKAITQAEAVLYQKDYVTEKFTCLGENIKSLTGYSCEEITADVWKGIIQESVMRGINEGLTEEEAVRRIRSGEVKEWKADYRIRKSNGEIRWMFDSSIQLVDTQGKSIGSLGILQDITERKLSEDKIKESEEKFRQIAENIDEVFWITDVEKKQMIYISPRYEEIWGRTCKSLYEHPETWLDAIHTEDRTRIQNSLEKQIRGKWDEEYRIVRPDGSTRWIRSRAFPIKDKSGKFYRITGIAEEITERKNSEKINRVLSDVKHNLSIASTPKEVAKAVMNGADELFGWDACAIDIYYEDTKSISNVICVDTSHGERKEFRPYVDDPTIITPIFQRTLKEGAQLILNNEPSSQPNKEFVSFGDISRKSLSLMFVPIRKKSKNIGILTFQSYTPNAYDEKKLKLLDLLAEHCSGALERTDSETALRESEKKYRETADLLPESIFEMDSNGKLTLINKAGFNKFNLSREDFNKGIIGLDLISPPDRKRAQENIQRTLQGEDLGNIEYSMLTLDGKTFPAIIHASPIVIDDKVTGLRGFVFDLSELQQTEEKLMELSQAVEQSPSSIIITDINGNIEYVNPKFTLLTGYSLQEVIGKNPRILKSGGTPVEVYKTLWDTISSGKEWKGEFQNKKKNGMLYWELASISPILNREGRITRYLAVKEDITVQKSLQDELNKKKQLAAVGETMENIAHSMKNIFTAHNGSLALIETSIKQKDWNMMEGSWGILRNSSLRLYLLIMNLLDHSKKREPVFEEIKLISLFEEVIQMLKPSVKEKDIKFEYTLEPGAEFIFSDSQRLHRNLMNLGCNAIDAISDSGKIRFTSYKRDRKDFDMPDEDSSNGSDGTSEKVSVIEVSDTGEGIPQGVMNNIFNPFFSTKGSRGTGLGLTSVKQIIEEQGGKIFVESMEGKGTIVRLVFSNLQNSQVQSK